MTAAKILACAGLWLAAGLAVAGPLIPPTAIDWLLDCPLATRERLDPDVLDRTQCGVVSVPRNYSALRQGSLRLYLTRVGARDPFSRAGVVFVLPGDKAMPNQVSTFALHLAGRWAANSSPAYRTLVNHYDLIELSTRDLAQDNGVDQAVLDMEFVRAQLGEAQLHYLGNAGAARLGNRYGAQFPERITRMVLINAEPGDPATPRVDQLRLKDPGTPGASGCIDQWTGTFLAYGRHPPRSSRCLDLRD